MKTYLRNEGVDPDGARSSELSNDAAAVLSRVNAHVDQLIADPPKIAQTQRQRVTGDGGGPFRGSRRHHRKLRSRGGALMSWYTVAWVVWLLLFLGLELPALFNKREGDTFSETVWRIFRVQDARPTAAVWAARIVLLIFLGWLFLHLGFGWLTPSHPLPWR